MKPIKLQLIQFGPYKDEVVNWSKLVENPIFLITGKTGAGKSTLFDAMTFALYNKTSGDKDIDTLRTKNADDKIKTQVIFEFELKGEIYKIERTLAYQKKGNKSKTSGKVELSKKIDNDFKVIESQDKNVIPKVESLLGLDVEQFKKIIILPQGKFKQFLISSSKDKSEILRSLFNTYFYQKFMDKLQEYTKQINDDYKEKEKEILTTIKTFSFSNELSNYEFLQKEIFLEIELNLEKYKEKLEQYKKQLTILENNYKDADEKLNKQIELNNKFEKLDEYYKEKNKLQLEEDKIENIKYELVKLKSLQENKDKITYYKKIENKLEQLNNDKLKIKNQLNEYDKNKKENNNLGEKLKDKGIYIDELNKYLEGNRYFYINIDSYKQAEKNVKEYKVKINKLELVKENKKIVERKLENINNNIKNNIEQELDFVKMLGGIDEKIRQYNEEVEVIKNFNEKKELLSLNKLEVEKLEEIYNKNKKEKEKLQKKLDGILKEKDKLLLNDFLDKLHLGDDCPLCQQKIEHLPQKTTIKYSEENYKKIFSTIEQLEKDIVKKQIELAVKREKIEQLEHDIAVTQKIINIDAEKQLAKYLKEKIDFKNKLDSIKIEKSTLENQYKKGEIELAEIKEQLVQEEKYKEILSSSKTKLLQIDSILANSTLEKFEKHYKENEEEYQQFLKDKLEYEKLKNELNVLYRGLEVDEKNNKEQLSETLENLKNIETEILGSDAGKYYKTILSMNENLDTIKKISSYEKEVADYKEKLSSLNANIVLYEQQTEDKEKKDLVSYEEKRDETYEKLETFKKQMIKTETKYEVDNKLYKNLYKEFEEWNIKDVENRDIIKLNNIISGKNENRKSLEVYVQSYYLDLILQCASKRLSKMTEGRYTLARKKEKEKGLAQQGLVIEVFDLYTNSFREISSLSGGEMFLASLALALGLAEVIQNENGSISLETIFIDEGFGSLDSETLDNVISILLDLQSYGRNIGIISHVSELKDRIKSRLEVYSKNNFSKTKIIGYRD